MPRERWIKVGDKANDLTVIQLVSDARGINNYLPKVQCRKCKRTLTVAKRLFRPNRIAQGRVGCRLCNPNFDRVMLMGPVCKDRQGMGQSVEYHCWHNTRKNALLKNVPIAPEIEDLYDGFNVFLREVGMRPSPKHRISRKVFEKGWVLGNMDWMSPTDHANSYAMRNAITWRGYTLTRRQWAEVLGVSIPLLCYYLRVPKKHRSLKRPIQSLIDHNKIDEQEILKKLKERK